MADILPLPSGREEDIEADTALDSSVVDGQSGNTPPLRKRRRVGLACRSCRRRKSRCDGARPICQTCNDLGHTCIYEAPSETPVGPEQKKAKPNDSASRTRPRPNRNDGTTTDDDEDIAVDALAPEALNDAPEPNIGHFGPSSNHAFFRFLSGIFAQQAQQMSLPQLSGSVAPQQGLRVERQPTSPGSSREDQPRRPRNRDGKLRDLPSQPALNAMINQFFATIGAVVPVVNRSMLPTITGKPLSRSTRALLNMVCAHAAASTGSDQAEDYYSRALDLLDERTMRGSTLELVQSLFLICLFQQNHQRSIASWTYHAMTVRAAYQLGIHAPTAYQNHGSHEREVRKRLWYAIVNQDRYLNISLGRPCLVPSQHVCLERPSDISTTSTYVRESTDNIRYFTCLTSLYHIQGSAIDQLYDHNIEPTQETPVLQKLASRTRLAIELERWRDEVAPLFGSLPVLDHEAWPSPVYEANRYRILLTLQYYSTRLVLNGPLLTGFLKARASRQSSAELDALASAALPAIENDYSAAVAFEKLINGISSNAPRFLDTNGAWWTCNFHMFTINLHLFGVLLACQRQDTMPYIQSITAGDVRDALESGVKTLHAVERTSHMSRKARHCLQSFLQVYDSLTSGQQTLIGSAQAMPMTTPGMNTNVFANDLFSDTYFAQWISQSADDFLLHTSQYDILDTDMSFL